MQRRERQRRGRTAFLVHASEPIGIALASAAQRSGWAGVGWAWQARSYVPRSAAWNLAVFANRYCGALTNSAARSLATPVTPRGREKARRAGMGPVTSMRWTWSKATAVPGRRGHSNKRLTGIDPIMKAPASDSGAVDSSRYSACAAQPHAKGPAG